MKLLIATHNAGKQREYAKLLQGLDIELVTLNELDVNLAVEEGEVSFEANALLKACAYAQATDLLTLADDSGLEVDALDGAPGVRSARYGGEGASDEERYRRLLQELEGVPDPQRTARFRCVIALAWPDGRTETCEGTCEGYIAYAPRGEQGFGYDPIFYVLEYGRTMAQLPPEVKNRISHRARAAAKAREILRRNLSPEEKTDKS
ncbi:MAG: non-canonical purine NTP pyrophosphatase, RdgB/HAM1 family [Chloroflexi bacterium RBG_13_56_8]|nr:MAG: non-canonical purine NTP pyrophosphatase, RdgB/HAM1 family [Chloroflexi bacterium RBG_13_56_8]